MITRLMLPEVALGWVVERAHHSAIQPEEDRELQEDHRRRLERKAELDEVGVEAYLAFHSDRWYPGAKTTEYAGVQVNDEDRAWLGTGQFVGVGEGEGEG